MDIESFDGIVVTANRSDEEPWRLWRLHRVLGYLAAWSDLLGSNLLGRIASLHDHKGGLQVGWRTAPSAAERGIVTDAWMSRTGDGSDTVEHVTPSGTPRYY